MLKDKYKVYEEKMKKSIESVANDFAAVRAGRANASVLNRIHVGQQARFGHGDAVSYYRQYAQYYA